MGLAVRYLKPTDKIDEHFGGFQCKELIDTAKIPWNEGRTGQWQCIAGSLDTDLPVNKDLPIYEQDKVLVDRGNTVDVNLDQGADLKFLGDEGHLIGWRYAAADDTTVRSQADLSVGLEEIIKAGCFQASITGIASFDQCLFEYNLPGVNIFTASVFDKTFTLGGFDSVSYTQGANPSDTPPTGGSVPEPTTTALVLLALCGVYGTRRRGGLW